MDVLKKLILAVGVGLILGGVVAITVHADDVFRWRHVGVNPCNPAAGCTLDWALAQAEIHNGWPREVTDKFKELTRGPAEDVILKNGWTGWMTEGSTPEKVAYHPNTLAVWPADQEEPAWRWQVLFEDILYSLLLVGKCKNWGGSEELRIPLPAEKPETENLGSPPNVACP